MPGITVRELLDISRFGMSVRAGAEGLDMRVTWAHLSEMEDPTPFVEGGELMLAGGVGISEHAAGQVEYLRRLHRYGLAALAIAHGPDMPTWTQDALDEADRLGFPVLEMPFEVSYVDIARLVAAANEQIGQQRLVRHLQIFETLQEYQIGAVELEAFVRRLSEVSGFDLYLSSPAGTEILPGISLPPPEVSGAAANGGTNVPGGYSVPIVVGGRTAAYLTALRRAGDIPSGLAAAQNLATVIGIPMRDLYQRREVERREGAEVLARLLASGHDASSRAGMLVRHGFEPLKPVVVVTIRSHGDDFDSAEIHHRLCDRAQPSMLMTRDDLVAVVPDLEQAMVAIEDVGFDVAIGVSAPISPGDDLATPWRQARWSAERAIARRQRVARFSPGDVAGEWLPLGRRDLEGVVDSVLGSVLDYDRTHGTKLIVSLRTLFRHDRRMKTAAAELEIHHHTLSYRMRTVERLSGRSVNELQGLVDLWLAVRALDVLEREQVPVPS